MKKSRPLLDVRKEIASAKVLRIENGKAVIGTIRKEVLFKRGGSVQISPRPFLKEG